VSDVMRRLQAQGLVDYQPYHPVTLTPLGETLALAMVRRHRLIECFLAEVLHYSWEEVHDDAERLEHAASPRFLDSIDALLGHPTTDPHGDPIPTRDGRVDPLGDVPLDRVPEGAAGVVTRVSDRDNTVLRHLAAIGLRPDSRVEVVSRQVELGIITVALDGRRVPMGTPVAAAVRVRVVGDDDDEVA